MNPSIEVQITARLDQLDAGLRVAEAKIHQSAVTMGKAGEQSGNAFVDNLASKIIRGTAILGVTQALGGVLMNAAKGMNAQKSGVEIMNSIADGLVATGKNIPIVGIFYSAFEEVINGADRFAEELMKKVGTAIERRIAATKTLMDMLKASTTKTEDIKQAAAAGKDPLKMLDEENRKTDIADQKEFNDEQLAEDERYGAERNAIKAKNAAAGQRGSDFYNREMRQAETDHLAKISEIQEKADDRDLARQRKFQADKNEIDKEQADQRLKTAEAAQKAVDDFDKATEAEQTKFALEVLANFKEQKKDEYDAAMQAQQDIIDANKQAQAQISKIGRVDELANQAARGMINSGQTALGQFNFVQAGAGAQAMSLAEKQVASLEKIEIATAEQVRLTKENKAFQ